MVTSSTTKVANLNADLLDGFDTSSVNIANTVVVRNSDGSFAANVITATLIGSANTAGTVTTAAQPNITSVGTLTSATVTGNISAGNVSATTFTGALSGAATTAGTVTTNAQPNITSVGTLTDLNVSGNGVFGGNLTVNGNLTYINTETLTIEDPIINLQTGANGAAPVANSGKDVGTALNYYDTQARVAFMGWDVSNVEFGLASVATIASEVVTFTTYGNLRVGNIIGNGQALTAIAGANVTGTVANATFATSAGTAGTVTTAAQPNITSVGTLNSANIINNSTGYSVQLPGVVGSATTDSRITTLSSRGSLGTPTQIQSGDVLLTITPQPYTGTAFTGAGRIQFVATEAIGALARGSRIELLGIPTGSATQATASWDGSTLQVDGAVGANSTITGTRLISNIATGTAPLTVTSTTRVANLNVATAGAADTAGTVTTAAQPNITSVSTSFSGLTFVANAQITMSGAGSQISGVNLISANSFSGNGSSITGINASSIASGTLAQARLANSTITFGNTTLTLGGTTTTVAGLTNITSTQLTSNVATGTAPLVVTSTTQVANLNVATAGTAGSATTAGTVTTAAQPNITSTGTLVNLAMSGTTAATFTDSTAASSSVQILQVKNGTQVLGIGAAMGPGSFNGLVGSNDIVIVGSNTAAQGNASISIVPWSTANGGIRIVTVSNVTSSINLTATTTVLSGALQTANITTGSNVTAGTVTGNWTLTAGSRWQATYADLAEKYAADDTYEPGTVLLFGGEQEVTLANAFDSTKVAGVVTTNPAYSMNAMLEAEYVAEIALQGRVPCKVIGPIEKGDLMVSASNGHATANNDARAGTIIGKALENFNGDFGVIEVAVGRF
jgi:hypothetical protein